MIRPDRQYTFTMDGLSMPEKRVPKRKMWISRCFNRIQLEIYNRVHLMEFMVTMRHFRKDIRFIVKLFNFNDEHTGNDKLVELLGYYRIDEVRLNGCSLNLRASCMFLM